MNEILPTLGHSVCSIGPVHTLGFCYRPVVVICKVLSDVNWDHETSVQAVLVSVQPQNCRWPS